MHRKGQIRIGLIVGILGLLPFAPGVGGQEKKASDSAPQDSVVRISTQLVQIDAIVTDKKGAHVEDLSEGDFELTIDGKPQPLSYLKLIRLVEPAAEAAPVRRTPTPTLTQMPTRRIEEEKVRRTIALVVDDLGLSFSSVHFAKEALRRFVDEQMQEGDLVGLIRTSGGFGIYQQFTSDKRILYAAIDKLRFALNGRKQIPFIISSGSSLMGRNDVFKTPAEKQHEEMAARRGPDLTANRDANTNTQRDTEQQEEFTRQGEKSAEAFRESVFASGTLGALNYVVRALRPLPGRKVAVIMSDGLRLRLDDTRYGVEMQRRIRNLIELANRSSVAFYSVNVEGLIPPIPDPARESIEDATVDNYSGADAFNDGLRTLAYDTGGLALYNNNRTDLLLKRAVDDNRSYYLLGFDPEDDKFDRKHHKIRLRLKRPGLAIRTREGFFGIEDARVGQAPATREGQLLSALFSPFGAREIPYQVTSLFFSSTTGQPVIRSYFHIDCSKLKFKEEENGIRSLTLELANFTFNEAGMIVESYAQSFQVRLDEARYRRAMAEGLTYLNDFPIKKPGAYQFRSALREASTGQLGSSSQFIQVPDVSKGRFALSGIILNQVENGAPAATASGEGDVLAASIAANPAARRFAANSEIEYLASIYNPRVDKQSGKPALQLQFELYRDGKPVFQSPERPVRTDRPTDPKWTWIDCGGRFQLKNFSAGDYLLRLVIRDQLREGKGATIEQWIDFTVR
ncbi:MAG: VWA domain-containing protein [Blastocatellia bacterium]|nr:VWA domain-containing protein [Blastocatellia bacterium]